MLGDINRSCQSFVRSDGKAKLKISRLLLRTDINISIATSVVGNRMAR